MAGKQRLPGLRAYLRQLRARGELAEITAVVDPHLEIAEIHRRVIAAGGPALLFRAVRGSSFPVVTNLFGTPERVRACFGSRPRELLEEVVSATQALMPLDPGALWAHRRLVREALRVGTATRRHGPITEVEVPAVDLRQLPALTSWHSDGGPFLTLPLVYTEDPRSGRHNLGMYRMQVHDPTTTGLHFQIHKGGGFHLHAAEAHGEPLPVTVFLGGPPALILAAISPLPEHAGELLLASLLMGERLPRVRRRGLPHPLVAEAEFALVGKVPPGLRRLEGPFGDHYGYQSHQEDYPVLQVERLFHRRDAIYPATVVGPPRQEDFHIGAFLQDLLSPLYPMVMPSVRCLHSYGETGFHPLAAAQVADRYPREALASGFRILGEGQLSLTKVLILTDQEVDLTDWPAVLRTLLERIDWRTDCLILDNLAQDSLDYTGPAVHRGSKALLLGLGSPRRPLPQVLPSTLPGGILDARLYQPGCLVLGGPPYPGHEELGTQLASAPELEGWPLLILVDDAAATVASDEAFLWTVFTRMEPAADLHARRRHLARYHVELEPPVLLDCRMKPWYPEVLEVDEATRELVDRRWGEYGLALDA